MILTLRNLFEVATSTYLFQSGFREGDDDRDPRPERRQKVVGTESGWQQHLLTRTATAAAVGE